MKKVNCCVCVFFFFHLILSDMYFFFQVKIMLHDLSVKQPEWAFARIKKVLSSYLLVLAKGRSILASVTNVVGSAKLLRKVVLVPSLNISQGMMRIGVTLTENLYVHGLPSIRYGRIGSQS